MTAKAYDEETHNQIKELWFMRGWSAAEIGAQIGKSRSAVLGYIHRTFAERRVRPERISEVRRTYDRTRRTAYEKKSKPLPKIMPRKYDLTVARRIPLEQIEHYFECRYIVEGEGASALYCAKPHQLGSRYCEHHHNRCHTKYSDYIRSIDSSKGRWR